MYPSDMGGERSVEDKRTTANMWYILPKFCAWQKDVNGKFPTVDKLRAHSDTNCMDEIRNTMFKTDTEVLVYYEALGRGKSADTPETKEPDVDNPYAKKDSGRFAHVRTDCGVRLYGLLPLVPKGTELILRRVSLPGNVLGGNLSLASLKAIRYTL